MQVSMNSQLDSSSSSIGSSDMAATAQLILDQTIDQQTVAEQQLDAYYTTSSIYSLQQ